MLEVDFVNIKNMVASLEAKGEWNSAIDLLHTAWKANQNDVNITIAFIGESYWLIKERDYIEYMSESARPIGWSQITWDFQDKMINVLKYGLDKFHECSWFLGSIGYLWTTDPIPFLESGRPYSYGMELLQSACALDPDNPLYLLFWDNNKFAQSAFSLELVKQKVDSLILRDTWFDVNLLDLIVKRLHASGFDVDWEVPM